MREDVLLGEYSVSFTGEADLDIIGRSGVELPPRC